MNVKLICHDEDVPFFTRLCKLFNVNLSKISVIEAKLRIEKDIQRIVPFDSIFFQISNGVPLLINCKKRILHHQIILSKLDESKAAKRYPEYNKDTLNVEIRRRFLAQTNVFFSSNFIKSFMVKHWSLNNKRCSVIYPFISDTFFTHPTQRQLKIISVGRFEQIKKQSAQIELFIKLQPHLPNSCKLVLIGSNKTPLSDELEKMAFSYPIEIKYGLSEKELLREYSDASIYWSTTGLEVKDIYKDHNVESFGLAMAEAMATGCVPVAINAGGVSEIVNTGKNGVLVSNIQEMGMATKKLLASPNLLKHMSEQAHKSVNNFSKNIFEHQIQELFKM